MSGMKLFKLSALGECAECNYVPWEKTANDIKNEPVSVKFRPKQKNLNLLPGEHGMVKNHLTLLSL